MLSRGVLGGYDTLMMQIQANFMCKRKHAVRMYGIHSFLGPGAFSIRKPEGTYFRTEKL
jgi:hypothetical protein